MARELDVSRVPYEEYGFGENRNKNTIAYTQAPATDAANVLAFNCQRMLWSSE